MTENSYTDTIICIFTLLLAFSMGNQANVGRALSNVVLSPSGRDFERHRHAEWFDYDLKMYWEKLVWNASP